MNKVILMGRLTRDPEVRYSNATEPVAIAKYGLAVNRRSKKEGQQDADFINIVAFGHSAEFAEKYFKKGQQVSVVGRLQTGSYEKDGVKHYTTEVIVEDQYFAEGKASSDSNRASSSNGKPSTNEGSDGGFYPINENIEDDDLPF